MLHTTYRLSEDMHAAIDVVAVLHLTRENSVSIKNPLVLVTVAGWGVTNKGLF